MSSYVVLAWRDEAASSAARLKAQLGAAVGLKLAVDRRGLAVFVQADRALACVQLPGLCGVVLGAVWDKGAAFAGRAQAAEFSALPGLDPPGLARLLAAQYWGRYVAVLPDPDGGLNLFRDPIGGLECLTWMRDGVAVASDELDLSRAHAPRRLAVNWSQVGGLLRQKNLSGVTVPLEGVSGVGPGVLRRANGREEGIWTPAQFAAASLGRNGATPRDLERTVDGCVSAQATGRERLLCEISGGLDSAIVMAALKRAGAPVVGAINHHWPQPESDERGFARAVTDQAGVGLKELARGLLTFDPDKLASVARAARPSFNAQDPDYDAVMAAELEARGADGLVTGQGGDAVFYQMPSPELFGDLMRGAPSGLGRLAAMAMLAKRCRRSIWSLAAEAARAWRRPASLRPPISFLTDACAAEAPGDRHPWLRDQMAVSPAKQVQIRALTNNLGSFGDSLRGQGGRLIQPLMSQPLVELCLAIPAPMLAIGDLDRPFARAAFAERVSAAVLKRRWKGDTSVFFARSMAENIPFLRDYLLDGQLVAHGLVDRAKLEAVLDPDLLIWFDHFGELTIALILEAWARWWETAIERLQDRSRRGPT